MAPNSENVFSALGLSEVMLESLPSDASPHLRDSYDAVALLSHACMLAVGFRLVGLGEDHKIPVTADVDHPTSLPSEWNASTNSAYSFRYAHSQSSLEYLIKISRLGSKTVVNGLGIGDEKVHTLDIANKDFISDASLPYTISKDASKEANAENLRQVFISSGRLTDAGSLLKLKIIQKLAPGLRKEGYEDSNENTSEQTQTRQPGPTLNNPRGNPTAMHDPLRDDRLPPYAQPRPFDDPLAAAPRRPFPPGEMRPPGFDDEYDILRRPGGAGPGGFGRPLNIGERDLYPQGLGPRDPLRSGVGGGFGPGGGGMHPTFDDPMFGGAGAGADPFNPRAPPGARYDPTGPGDGPPNLGRGPRGGFGGAPHNPFGGFGGNDFI